MTTKEKKVVVDGDELTVYGGGAWLVDADGKKWRDEAEYRYFKARRPRLPTVTHPGGPTDPTVETHPAYALIDASRIESTGTALFGSDFKHRSFVQVTIARAEMNRSLSRDWPHPRQELIQVMLSEAAWAAFISTLNHGVGVPCTIDSLAGEPPIPGVAVLQHKREQFKAEASEDLVESEQRIDEALALVRAGKMRKGELETLLIQAKNHLTGGVNFVAKSFGEHVESTIEHAKVEVEAYINSTISRAGLAALGAPPRELDTPGIPYGTRVRCLRTQRLGTAEGPHPIHGGVLVRYDGDYGQSLNAVNEVERLNEP